MRTTTAALPAVLFLLAGCTTTVAGTAVPAAKAPPATPAGIVLRQQPGSGPPRQFGGTPAYDACTVLPLDVVAKAGFPFDLDHFSPDVVKSSRLVANAGNDPHQVDEFSDTGITSCQYPGQHDLLVTFTIHQTPFDGPRGQSQREEAMRANGGKDGTAAGFRTLTETADSPLHTEATMIYADGFYATLDLVTASKTPSTLGTTLVQQAAQRLHAPPTAPATYAYEGDFAHVRPPCEIFTADDFRTALGFGTDGRAVEEYSPTVTHTTPDAASDDHQESTEVRTTCKQENQAAANMGVGDTPAQGVTLEFTNYMTPQMAARANDYDCNANKPYERMGPPKPVPFSVGDGLSCLVNMGGSVQSPLAFKSGRTTVEMSVWSVAGLKDDATAIHVYTTVAQTVAAKLAAG